MAEAFITLEGPEGGGKTLATAALADRLVADGHRVVPCREPGGTVAGERIRGILLDPGLTDIGPRTETLLFCAARAELLSQVIRPALDSGAVVLCDRYADATLAYQGYGAGLDLETLRAVIGFATGGLVPDLTLLLDIPVRVGLERRRNQPGTWNRLDAASAAFHERVRAGYLALASAEPHRWRVVDATAPPDVVADRLYAEVAAVLVGRTEVAQASEQPLTPGR